MTTEKQLLGENRANLENFVIKLETGKPEKEGFSFLHENVDLGCFPLFPLIGWMNIYLTYPKPVKFVQVPKGNLLQELPEIRSSFAGVQNAPLVSSWCLHVVSSHMFSPLPLF